MYDIAEDSQILGDLPETIRQASIHKPRVAKKPEEYDRLLSEIQSQLQEKYEELLQAEPIKFGEFMPVQPIEVVEFTFVIPPDTKPKRVPRAWWGWTIKLYKRVRTAVRRIS